MGGERANGEGEGGRREGGAGGEGRDAFISRFACAYIPKVFREDKFLGIFFTSLLARSTSWDSRMLYTIMPYAWFIKDVARGM